MAIKDINLWATAWACAYNDIRKAICVEIATCNIHPTGKFGAESEEVKQGSGEISSAIKHLNSRSATCACTNDHIRDAIVIYISNCGLNTTCEVFFKGKEACEYAIINATINIDSGATASARSRYAWWWRASLASSPR